MVVSVVAVEAEEVVVHVEPCAAVIVLASVSRSILVGGGAAWTVKSSNLAYLFQKFFSKGMHVKQLGYLLGYLASNSKRIL